MTDELPPGWARAPLASVGVWGSGGTPSRGDAKAYGGDIPWLKIGDLPDGPVASAEEHITKHGLAVSSAKLLPPGTLLVAMYGSIGKLGVTTEPCATNQAIAFCKPHTGFELGYLFYLLMGERHRLIDQGQGGTQLNISQTILKAHEVAIAPPIEQRQIVSKIEQLFSCIDEGERALERAQKLVERYRQSILKAAVTGELTSEWREKNKGALESGEVLLARILKARREAWEKAELAKMKAKGITPANEKWKQKYCEPASPDTTNLPELPHGWIWTSLESLCPPERNALKAGPFGSALKKSDYSEGGYKIYGQEQVIAGDWSIGDYFVGESKYQQLESCKVRPFDVLISLVGTIGKVLVLPAGSPPGIINPRLIKVSLNLDVYSPLFFKTYFESAFLKSLYRSESHGATMDVLNMGIIEKLPFPLCGLDEQRQIVARCADGFDKITRLKAEAVLEERRSTALRQSVLKSAFSGKLVAHCAFDKPASSLLDHIVAERSMGKAAPKRGHKKKTAA